MAIFFFSSDGVKIYIFLLFYPRQNLYLKKNELDSWALYAKEDAAARQPTWGGVVFEIFLYLLQNIFFHWMLLSLFTRDLSNEN